jgi:hypothetical protein
MAAQDLNIKITASDQTGAAFSSVQQKMGGMASSVVSVTGKIGALTAALGSIAAVGAAVRFVSEMTSQTIRLADALDELSAKTNIGVTELSALTNSAQFAGISQDELASSIMYLQKSIGEAAIGTKEQATAFKNLGIEIKDVNGNIRPTTDILTEIAARLSQVEDGAIKTQYQLALFGRAGGNLNEYLNKGGEGIRDFSNVISEDGAKAAAAFNDNLDWMGQRIRSWLSEHHGFLDFLNRQFEEVKRVDKEIKQMGRAGGGRGFVNPEMVTPATNGGTLPALTTSNTTQELTNKLSALRVELDKITMGEDAALVAELKRLGASKEQIAAIEKQLRLKAQLKNQDEELLLIGREFDKLEEDRKKKQKDLADAGKALYDSTRTPLEKFNIEMARLDDLLAKGVISWDVYSRAVLDAADQFDPLAEKGKDTFQELRDAMAGWGNDFTNVMADAVMTGKFQFNDMANSIIKDLIRIQVQKSITDPLIKMGTSFLDGIISGTRATGGPVTGGNSYLVGENGPEIFTPGMSGGITPNNAISGGGVTVNQVINVTTGVQQTVRAEIMTLMPQIAASAKSAVADAKLRGGSYANALR